MTCGPPTELERQIDEVLANVRQVLISKNKTYGNSALEPVRIFSKADAAEQLKVRIDDKISRLLLGADLNDQEDTVTDLIGYFVLLKIAQDYYGK
jgi:hypothetical protein